MAKDQRINNFHRVVVLHIYMEGLKINGHIAVRKKLHGVFLFIQEGVGRSVHHPQRAVAQSWIDASCLTPVWLQWHSSFSPPGLLQRELCGVTHKISK